MNKDRTYTEEWWSTCPPKKCGQETTSQYNSEYWEAAPAVNDQKNQKKKKNIPIWYGMKFWQGADSGTGK